MQDKRYIICGNAPTDGIEENPDRDLRLRLWGKDGPDKITLRIEDIHKKMSKESYCQIWCTGSGGVPA
jgi:hypothetical protein